MLVRWHEAERRKQEKLEMEVRERNRRRRRELLGDLNRPATEEEWREGAGDASEDDKSLARQKKAEIKRKLQGWIPEAKPRKGLGLIVSGAMLYGITGIAVVVLCLAFGLIALTCMCLVGSVLFGPRTKNAQGPNPPVVKSPDNPANPPDDKHPPIDPPKPKGTRFLDPPRGLVVVAEQKPVNHQTSTVEDVEFKSFSPFSGRAEWAAWTADGRSFYMMQRSDGIVARVNADKMITERSLTIGRNIHNAAVSKFGVLIVSPPDGIYLLDPDNLEVKLRIDVPNVLRVFSAPTLALAFVKTTDKNDVLLDLEKKEVVGEPFNSDNLMASAVLTPDGKFLFGVGGSGSAIVRYRIDSGKLTREQTGPEIANGSTLTGVNLSADGRYVCLPSPEANRANVANHPAVKNGEATYLYSGDDLTKPVVVLRPEARLRGVAFDTEQNRIYGCNVSNLMMYDEKGEVLKAYAWPPECKGMNACLLNPKKRQLLLATPERICVVTWQPP
jgi:hypothetical protein